MHKWQQIVCVRVQQLRYDKLKEDGTPGAAVITHLNVVQSIVANARCMRWLTIGSRRERFLVIFRCRWWIVTIDVVVD